MLDSGVGGLTVVKTMLTELPDEDFVYFGDTAHLPYGSKTPEELITYARNIICLLYTSPGPLEEIRRQLSDRFDMVCYMGRPDSVDILAQMLKENSHVYKNRRNNNDEDDQGNEVYRKNIVKWAGLFEQADLPDFLRNFIARLYIKHNLESIRAIEAMQQGAVLHSICLLYTSRCV